ncbi:MAG: hypothetical protein KF713_06680 [Turneriella sp.]|nr:hypothetical protein [Turneriella sp.]
MRFDRAAVLGAARARVAAFATRRVLRSALVVITAVLLWFIADALPSFFFNSKAFQARLNEVIDASGVAISYQGVDVSLFRGIRIIGVRVSFDKDFSRGRYLLEAPAVYIHVPFGFPNAADRDWLSRARIIIDEGKVGYWLTADAADKDILAQVRKLMQENLSYHVECDDCRFTLNVKDNSYFQEVIPVQGLYFTLHHAGKELQALVRYESSTIGDGDFFGKFKACVSLQCDDLEGYWYFKPTGLKTVLLNNFQKEYDITSGVLSGEVAFDRNLVEAERKVGGKTEKFREPVSNFRMAMAARDFTISKKKREWYHSDSFAIDTKMLIQGQSSTGYVRAALESYNINAEFEDLRPDALPEKYTFRIEPKLFGKKLLRLPAQKKLYGLTNLAINLSGRNGNKYAKTEMNLDIVDGGFSVGDERSVPTIRIPEAHLALANEKLSGEIKAASGLSQLAVSAQGALELYPVAFKPRLNALMREHGRVPEQKIFALRGRVSAPLVSENLYWNDLKPYVNYWLDEYWEEVREGMHYSWLPSHLKRREYFVRFFEYMDFAMPIEIKNFDWGQKTPLKGELYFAPQYSGGTFRLSSADGKNWTSLSASYAGDEANSPWFTHNLRLNLDGGYDLLKPWFGGDYFEHFSGFEIVHDNNFNGERAADHYLKTMSVTDIRLKRVRLGAWARAQQLPLQWETVDVRTNRSNGFGAVTQVRADNENTVFSGSGEYKLFDRILETNLKHTILIK